MTLVPISQVDDLTCFENSMNLDQLATAYSHHIFAIIGKQQKNELAVNPITLRMAKTPKSVIGLIKNT